MRVLLYVHGLESGGSEKRVERLALGLDPSRFDCVVGWRRPWGPVGDRLVEASVRVQRLAFLSPADEDQARRQIRDIRPEIFHSFSGVRDALDVSSAHAAGVPVVITSRVGMRHWDPDRRIQPWERARNAQTHLVTSVSEAAARLAIAVEGLPANRVAVVRSGVEIPVHVSRATTALRGALGLGERTALVGCAANYRREKGHALLLEAFQRVLCRHPESHLICCGLDAEGRRAALMSRARDLGIAARVSLLETTDDVASFYRGLDLYVQPSLSEGFSNAILEAMSYGLPVVATAIGGNPEAVVDAVTGVLTAANDPSAMADAIVALLGDRERRRALGRAGRARCEERFSVAAMVAAHERLYESLRPSPPPGPTRRARRRGTRILFHLDYLWRGGLENQVANLVRGMDRSRFEPVVSWSRRWGAVGRTLAAAGVHLVRIDPRRGLDGVVAQIRELRPDILHSFSCTPGSDVVLGARRAGVPIVLTSRSDVRFWDPAGSVTDVEIERNDATDGIIACSRAVAATCMAVEGVPPAKVTVIHGGVGLPAGRHGGRSIRAELGLDGGALLVGYVATYRSIKAHAVLLRAFRAIVDRQPLAHLVCCGEEYDDTRAGLERQVDELDLRRHVSLLAARSDVDAVYRGLDVYAHPSFSEGFSMAILEAMAHGLPLVASSAGGTPEAVVDGGSGILVPPGDGAALASAILELLANPARRLAFGRAGRDRIRRRFSLAAMVRAHEEVYALARAGLAVAV